MLDNGGDSVVLVSTIPSPFIVADDLQLQQGASSVPRSCDQSAPSPDDCSEITSTVADEPSSAAPVKSPSAASPSPPPHESTTAAPRPDVPACISATQTQTTAAAASTTTATLSTAAQMFTTPIISSSTSVTTTTTRTTQQAGRLKKSLEMVVNRLKRPATSITSSSTPILFTVAQSTSRSLPVISTHQSSVTSSSVVPTSGHVVQNGGGGSTVYDDSVGVSLLQRLVAAPAPTYTQLPVPTTSHFRFRYAAAGNSLMAARMESGPPIKQLKHMCKNVRSFVPSGPRRAMTPWRHPALDMLFGSRPQPSVPMTRHRAAVQFPSRGPGAAAHRGAGVRGTQDFTRPRFHAPPARPTTAAAGASRDRKQHGDGELSALMRVLLEASDNSCHTSTASTSASASYPSTAHLWKATIN